MTMKIQKPNAYTVVQVKAVLFHLDGTESEITMNIPKYTRWGEFIEAAVYHIEKYVEYLSAHWVQISHFDITTHACKPNGETEDLFFKKTVEIPQGKIFDRDTGKWMTPAEGMDLRRARMGVPTA